MSIYQYPLKIEKEIIDQLRIIAENNSKNII